MKSLIFIALLLCSCVKEQEHRCGTGMVDNENHDGITEYILIEDIHGNIYELHPSITTQIKEVRCK